MKDNKRFGIDEQELKVIVDLIKKSTKVKRVIIFGSRVKGNYKIGSDIDIAIDGDEVDFNLINEMRVELDELILPYKLDIIDYRQIENIELKRHIDRVGVSL